MSEPEWVKHAIFYQIFPDRFYNGNPSNDPENVQSWGNKPNLWCFQGGDLDGILEKLDYLLDLGITAIYLNPIFLSPSSHRYNTVDYYQIDPKLGNLNSFRRFLDASHNKGIKIILDGVFNHTGRGFFAFNDILENGKYSPYKNWYYIHRFPVDAYGPGDAVDYYGWWNYKSLPKLNTFHPAVREYLFNVAEHWIKFGIDGWRLDVPNEIDDDTFWQEFRYRVRKINPQAYLVGEIWDIDPRWVNETHFDGVMNYPLKKAIISFLLRSISNDELLKQLNAIFSAYPKQNLFYLLNLLGSHDTERLFTILNEDLALVKLGFFMMLTLPGAPSIYYGDEIGLTGGKDPLSRKAFPWDQESWNSELRVWIQNLIQIRKQEEVLRVGDIELINVVDHQDILCYTRVMDQAVFIIMVNVASETRKINLSIKNTTLKKGNILKNILGNEQFSIDNDDQIFVDIPPKSALLLKNVKF
ncbi:MAG: alpha-amylase [Anaerolineaceae bacterium]|nr:alpha-amylase [Anaerolineaceae bacterium]